MTFVTNARAADANTRAGVSRAGARVAPGLVTTVNHACRRAADAREVGGDVRDLAGRCVAQRGSGAAVLCPLAGVLAKRLDGRYHAQALLTLALTLAKREFPSLRGVDVMADGSLTGLPPETPSAVLTKLVAHALRLCMTNFGEDETGRLVVEAWPELR